MAPVIPYKNILFVLNPISGDIVKDSVREMLEQYCRENSVKYQVYSTTGAHDTQTLKLVLQEYEPELVVAIGGDGTVSLAANLLNHSGIPLAIIPQGSGNGLSKDLGIPQTTPEALALLQTGAVRAIDSLEINGKTAFHLCDLGFNAHIVKKFDEGNTRGPAAYAKIALQEYISYQPQHYYIKTDKEEFTGQAFMVTIANANAFGSNATINPTGQCDDGIFEICLLEPFPKTAALGILYNLYTDTIQQSVYSRILKCQWATILKTADDVLQMDGEPALVGDELNIRVHPQSLHVLVPPAGTGS